VPKPPWNHNIHYHRLLLAAMPDPCEAALDVGCGEGVLARRLRERAVRVVAIDSDHGCVELARGRDPGATIDCREGDFMTEPLAPASFDFIVCVAALHHMDEEAALRRMRELLRPGGTLAVLDLPRPRYPAELARDALATLVHRAHQAATGYWQSPAPTLTPARLSYPEIRRLAERVLPGARLRRHLLWRYSIVWSRPAA
jgi:2-polyprenyl-3-methyl-5-hydroxy-6-metoxy-1,4-benzoquinol methylase